MNSKWIKHKEQVLEMRKQGISMTVIERKFGIARSTLSGWFKFVPLTEEQRTRLMKNKQDGWAKARKNAVESHRAQKVLRLLDAKAKALETLNHIELSAPVLDLAFAMLYLGEGAKHGKTSIANSDPMILRFVINVLQLNYKITPEMIRCELHLRMDQNKDEMKSYWARELNVPAENFTSVAFDKRTTGRATYEHYKGVCVINCGPIAIQRKLIYLYTLFCERITELDIGVGA